MIFCPAAGTWCPKSKCAETRKKTGYWDCPSAAWRQGAIMNQKRDEEHAKAIRRIHHGGRKDG